MKIFIFLLLSTSVMAQDGRIDTLTSIDKNLIVLIRNNIDSVENYTVSLLKSYGSEGNEFHLRDTVIQLTRKNFKSVYLEIEDKKPYQFVLDTVNNKRYYVNSDIYVRTIFGIRSYLKCVTNNVVYPKQAMKEKKEGNATFRLFLNENGCIDYVRKTSNLGFGIEEAGIEAFDKCDCEFIPGIKQKKNVAMIFFLPVKFRL